MLSMELVSNLLSALIGAVSAIGAVFIGEEFIRRRAHTDRLSNYSSILAFSCAELKLCVATIEYLRVYIFDSRPSYTATILPPLSHGGLSQARLQLANFEHSETLIEYLADCQVELDMLAQHSSRFQAKVIQLRERNYQPHEMNAVLEEDILVLKFRITHCNELLHAAIAKFTDAKIRAIAQLPEKI